MCLIIPDPSSLIKGATVCVFSGDILQIPVALSVSCWNWYDRQKNLCARKQCDWHSSWVIPSISIIVLAGKMADGVRVKLDAPVPKKHKSNKITIEKYHYYFTTFTLCHEDIDCRTKIKSFNFFSNIFEIEIVMRIRNALKWVQTIPLLIQWFLAQESWNIPMNVAETLTIKP